MRDSGSLLSGAGCVGNCIPFPGVRERTIMASRTQAQIQRCHEVLDRRLLRLDQADLVEVLSKVLDLLDEFDKRLAALEHDRLMQLGDGR